nr:hypothetical protein [Tanacetum cinerariifolium]
MLQELKSMFEKQAGVERFDLIQTFHASKQEEGKPVGSASSTCIFTIELFSFPNKSWVYNTGCDTHICITKQGLRGAKKLEQGALYLYVGNCGRAQVEAIRSFDLVLPNGLVICLDNCHYAPTITRGVVSVHRLVENGFIQCFMDYGILVSKNDVLYFNAISRDGYLKETMGYYFYFLPENKIVVARYAEFFKKSLITQEVTGRAIDLEEIQDEDTSPSKITSEIPMEVEGFESPQNEVISIRSMTLELHRQFEDYSSYEMLQELKYMFEKQARVERFDLIQTFHACKQEEGKPVGFASFTCIFTIELFSFPNKSWVYNTGCDTHICITKKGLRGAKKLEQGALYLYVGNGGRAQVEAVRSFDLVLPNGLVICLDNCHYAPTITRGVVSVHRLVENGFIQCFMDYGILVSKNDVRYFNAIPRDGIYEIDMHNLVPKVNSIYNVSNKRAKHNLDSTYLWHCKMTRKPFPHHIERATDLLGIIHTDVHGPLRHVSRQDIRAIRILISVAAFYDYKI